MKKNVVHMSWFDYIYDCRIVYSIYNIQICLFTFQAAFRYAYEQHLSVVIKCNYLASFYNKNHEKYHNLRVRISLD